MTLNMSMAEFRQEKAPNHSLSDGCYETGVVSAMLTNMSMINAWPREDGLPDQRQKSHEAAGKNIPKQLMADLKTRKGGW